MKTTKREKRQAWLEAQYAKCAQLLAICGNTKISGKKASTELFKLETQVHGLAVAYCNGEERCRTSFRGMPSELNFRTDGAKAWAYVVSMTKDEVRRILGQIPPGFFVNGDARGHALKLEPASVPVTLQTDWGQNQILSPEMPETF